MGSAQASVEFLVLVTFFIVFLIPIVAIMFNLSGEKADESAMVQAHRAGRSLADGADEVYFQGSGATKIERLFFPSKIKQVTFEPVNIGLDSWGEITISMATTYGDTDVVFMTTAPLRVDPSDSAYWSNPDNFGGGTKNVRLSYGINPSSGVPEVVVKHEN